MENDIFKNLNDKQLQAVKTTEGPVLILAGAGSGKTTVIIHRIYYLINYLNISPYNILAITFTNKAAEEMNNRLLSLIGDVGSNVWALTFHSFCVRLLRKDSTRIGFDSNFTIYDTSDSITLIKHILKDFNIDEKILPPKLILNEISRAKDALVLPSTFLESSRKNSDFHKIKLAEVYSEYMKRMKLSNAMDFDDLLLYSVELLRDNEDVRSYWQNRFKYILIDEYQDTNNLQYLLASLLTNSNKNLCVVGDDDQSIYKFRGATIENILSFESNFNNCKLIRLEQNYRSTGHILSAANDVIRNNIDRKGKELWTDRGNGDLIEYYYAENQDEEAKYVSNMILSGFSSGKNWRDFAVLYRVNAQSNNIEYSFKRSGIPYRIVGGTRFFDRAEVKDILAYLCVINSPNDNLRLERIINVPARGIGQSSVEKANYIASSNNLSLFEVIKNAEIYTELSRVALKMKEFADLMLYLIEFANNNPSDLIFDELLVKTNYLFNLETKNTIEDAARAENVKEIKSSILSYINDSGDDTLEGYLSNVALYTDLDNYDKDSDAVTLMTIHSAKGLEFPTVFLVGMEESIFPSIRSYGSKDEMEEERRLCYVAITRAKDNLFIISAKQRMLYGKTNVNKVSRFIDEISNDHINKYIPKGYTYTNSIREESDVVSNTPIKPLSDKNSYIEKTFNINDKILHKAFGEGIIINMTSMGNDYLIEIKFDKCGDKKLMLRAASNYMSKI